MKRKYDEDKVCRSRVSNEFCRNTASANIKNLNSRSVQDFSLLVSRKLIRDDTTVQTGKSDLNFSVRSTKAKNLVCEFQQM
jgi:hypothetical protein